MLKVLAVVGAIIIFACKRQSDGQTNFETHATPASPTAAFSRGCTATDTLYFARSALADREAWYGKHLRAMKEPVLCPDSARERYRFLWLRTFHRPVAVRIEHGTDQTLLVAKELNGAGGYEPGIVVRDTSIELSREQWAEFRRLLNEATFWQLPTHWPPEQDTAGEDGSHWILEGTLGDRYHVIDRWTPEQNPRDASFRRAALFLLSVSTLKPRDTEIY